MSECVLSSSKNPWAIPLRRALGESDCQSRQDKWILVSVPSGSTLTDWEELSLCRQACFIFKLINLNKIFYPSLWVLPLWQLCWTGLGWGCVGGGGTGEGEVAASENSLHQIHLGLCCVFIMFACVCVSLWCVGVCVFLFAVCLLLCTCTFYAFFFWSAARTFSAQRAPRAPRVLPKRMGQTKITSTAAVQ